MAKRTTNQVWGYSKVKDLLPHKLLAMNDIRTVPQIIHSHNLLGARLQLLPMLLNIIRVIKLLLNILRFRLILGMYFHKI